VVKSKRLWEIDTFRGIAIIMMIVYHIIFDFNYFGIYKINIYFPPLRVFLYSIGTIFLLIVGISLHLSFLKNQMKLKYLKRGLMIFFIGILITIVTWFYPHDGFIVFGVLHCIGLSIILSYPFLKLYYLNLVFGLILVSIGIFLTQFSFDFNYILFLGFRPDGFYTLDYFPILPWFGVVLIGIFIGKLFYKKDQINTKSSYLSEKFIIKKLAFLGRHSLIIYLIHQPILIAIILTLNFIF
jgi:uncharacterized membrane protein